MSVVIDDFRQRGRRGAYSDILDATDQWRVRADLTAFFGPNADTYLDVYERMRANSGVTRMNVRTWSWPVFLGSFTWFFYRKMYAYGAMLIFLPLVLSYLFGSAGGAMPIIFAMMAKRAYVSTAFDRIRKADKLGLAGWERTDYMQRAGGVSWTAGIFGGLIYALALLAVVAGVVARHGAHQP
jgi:hypothetical protein